MIAIHCPESGDTAEAETPEAAIRAGQILRAEARDNGYGKPSITFTVAGVIVRTERSAF